MSTKIFGVSDDLIEFEGDLDGEVSYYSNKDSKQGLLITIDDGTILEINYGKGGSSIWGIFVIKKGNLFDKLELCDDEDAEIYSDIVFMKDGCKTAYASSEWEKVS